MRVALLILAATGAPALVLPGATVGGKARTMHRREALSAELSFLDPHLAPALDEVRNLCLRLSRLRLHAVRASAAGAALADLTRDQRTLDVRAAAALAAFYDGVVAARSAKSEDAGSDDAATVTRIAR